MFCTKCGKQIPDNSAFCAYCGKSVYDIAPEGTAKNTAGLPKTAPPTADSEAGRARVKPWMFITIGVVLVLAIVGIVILLAGDGPHTAAPEELLADAAYLLEQGEYEEVILTYNEYINIEPKDPAGYIGLANTYDQMGDRDKLITTLEQGLRETEGAPELLDAWERLLSAYEEAGWLYYVAADGSTYRISTDGSGKEEVAATVAESYDAADFNGIALAQAAWIFRQYGGLTGPFYACDADQDGLSELYLNAEWSYARCAYKDGRLAIRYDRHSGAAGNTYLCMLPGDPRPVIMSGYFSTGVQEWVYYYANGLEEGETIISGSCVYGDVDYEYMINNKRVSEAEYLAASIAPESETSHGSELSLQDSAQELLNYRVSCTPAVLDACFEAYAEYSAADAWVTADIDGDGAEEAVFVSGSSCEYAFNEAEGYSSGELTERDEQYGFPDIYGGYLGGTPVAVIGDFEDGAAIFKTVMLNDIYGGIADVEATDDGMEVVMADGGRYGYKYTGGSNTFEAPALRIRG